MLPDRVSNPGPLTCESGVLPIALRGPADPNVGSSFVPTAAHQKQTLRDPLQKRIKQAVVNNFVLPPVVTYCYS